ncbi:UDP-N-acetylmuramoyl-tripeptide--D-alanyl-D-alanine ligase [Streptomyces bikiniensis]|uniref:UDP-N-acetylmuramoyl-tripeptide--D-alanyl-D- alanine ligase n=1 Tax=Streptomyces bikiniensis TaxID=1896 RepID=UPI000526C4CA|nr:UDP-N-acetylmuramoyl-tripeptide--D-alanyl-D-alanine ligase [Streptomyces bikiniensis]
MIPMTLSEIATATGGVLHTTDGSPTVTAPLAFDSRHPAPGALFACLSGALADGHDFAAHAVAQGAVAVLAQRPVRVPAVLVPDVLTAMSDLARTVHRRYDGTTIGITGSAGKTTTKDLLAHLLAAHGPTVANRASFNNEIGFPVTVTGVRPDTRYLVLEMGARGKGHIQTLCDIAGPGISTVLGIGSAHVGEFGSREAIADAKAEIVRALPATGTAVLNADDPLVTAMAREHAGPILTFGTGEGADVRATGIGSVEGRPFFTLRHRDQAAPVQLALHGRHNTTNALAAAATALAAGVPFDTVAAALPEARMATGGRMAVTTRTDDVTIINDAFNASPESVLAALDALTEVGRGRRRVAVLGEMAELGEASTEWHRRVADAAARAGLARLLVVGTGEDADTLAAAYTAATGTAPDRHTPATVGAAARSLLLPGDVLLVKGAHALGLDTVANQLLTV